MVAIGLGLGACVTAVRPQSPPREQTSPRSMDARTIGHDASAGEAVARAARDLVGRRVLRVDGRAFPFDCTGTILAAFYAAGIDLTTEFERRTGNGVARLYAIAEERTLLIAISLRPGEPRSDLLPGDVLFFDNTYDRNGDRRWNDELTHAAIVIEVGLDGAVTYVHHNYRLGIVIEQLHLRHPGDNTLNSPMRMRGHRFRPNDPWLAGELVRQAGRLSRSL